MVRWVGNGAAVSLSDVPTLSIKEFRESCLSVISSGGRLSALTLLDREARDIRGQDMIAVLADDTGSRIGMVRTPVP